MLTLLSPAKTLDFDSPAKEATLSDHVFPKESMQLVRLLKKQSVEDIKGLMKISDALASLNVQRYKSFSKEYTTDNSRAALEAFRGDVYVGLDYPTLSTDDITYAQDHLRILSGLYGLLRPLDKMQPYRLEMGTRLVTKAGTNLYHFWGDKITKALNKELKASGTGAVLNLASNEYFKAIDRKKLKGTLYEANFKEERDGKLKFISFSAKKARGLMARYVVQQQISDPEDLRGFDLDGYYYSEEHSTPDSLLFVR